MLGSALDPGSESRLALEREGRSALRRRRGCSRRIRKGDTSFRGDEQWRVNLEFDEPERGRERAGRLYLRTDELHRQTRRHRDPTP